LKIVFKKQNELAFFSVTLIFIASRFVLFNGFHGTDDLHYAMLAAKMTKAAYTPFQPNDIFSGRILLIAWQAFIYKIGGISVFTTTAGNIAAIILSCRLTIYRILPLRHPGATLLTCCLFYFNAKLAADITGISPDPYVLLIGVCITILLKNNLTATLPQKKSITNAILIGVLIAVSVLIKETILVFLPFSIAALCIYRGKRGLLNSFYLLFSFIALVGLFVYGYYYFTGDPFFKATQIENSNYPNACNFAFMPAKELMIRLSYGVWQSFIVYGFYPCLLGLIALIVQFRRQKSLSPSRAQDIVLFCLLLVISIYFPFSLHGYQPLCAVPRQFMFLVPLAAAVFTPLLIDARCMEKNKQQLAILSFILLVVCISSTLNKWQWMIYSIFFIYFLLQYRWQLPAKFHFIFFSIVLFASNFEGLFFNNARWFADMKQLNRDIHSNYYYFADQENMAHWNLLTRFDTTIHNYNMEAHPYKVFQVYYQLPDTINFHPGWFIVNSVFTDRPRSFVGRMDSLQQTGFFSACKAVGNMRAFSLDNEKQFSYLKAIIARQQ